MKRIQLGGEDLTPFLNKIRSVHKHSYNDYFQLGVENRQDTGLHKLLNSIFPIQSKTKELTIRYVDYSINSYVYDEETLMQRQMSYTMTVKINLTIEYKDSIQPYSIYLSNIPVMLDDGCFLINGTKKVIIYHLCKTGGLYFSSRNHNNLSLNISTTMGSLITFSLSSRNILCVSINKSKKFSLLMFLKLFEDEQINRFLKYHSPTAEHEAFAVRAESMLKYICIYTKLFTVTAETDRFIIHNAADDISSYFMTKLITYEIVDNDLVISRDSLHYAFLGDDITLLDGKRNEIRFRAGTMINESITRLMEYLQHPISFRILVLPNSHNLLYRSLNIHSADDTEEEEEEVVEDESEEIEDEDIQSEDKEITTTYKILEYQLNASLRARLSSQLNTLYSTGTLHLTEEDFILSTIYIVSSQSVYRANQNLYNTMIYKKIKRPEEFIDNIISSHLYKVKKNVSIRNNFYANFQGGFDDIINYYSISTDIKKVFNIGTAIQYLDQTNLLSQVSHLRRVSAIYSSSSDKYRVPEIERGVNLTQYGRICTTETPEGQKIGLITAIACTALINDEGMLIVPYFRVINEDGERKIDTVNLVYLTAEEEYEIKVASFADIHTDDKYVLCRHRGNIIRVIRDEIEYYDVLPYQMFSYASALIPFLQNNDARRALMSANMQKQAVPLTRPDRPIVGTGVERVIIKNFTRGVTADERIRVYYQDAKYMFYGADLKSAPIVHRSFAKFNKTNMKTSLHEYPVINSKAVEDNSYDIREVDSPMFHSTNIQDGELSLGNNVLVAFLSWNGYNFEDSVVASERLRRDSLFESPYINDVIVKGRDLEQGVTEQFSANAPSISPDKHAYLDNRGIVKEGTYLRSGMIAVGRIIPIQSTEVAPEENILSIIFNKKISNIRDISYRIPYNEEGYVINVIYYSYSHPNRSTLFSKLETRRDQINYLYRKAMLNKVKSYYDVDIDPRYTTFDDLADAVIKFNDDELNASIAGTRTKLEHEINRLNYFIHENRKINTDSNVSEFVSFYLIQKRYLEVGDKVTGRYGNKGVVSIIVPMEDMPFLNDGTPIDMLLTPLGIPNRLNIGQVFEMHIGAFSYMLTKKIRYAIRSSKHEQVKLLIREHLAPITESTLSDEYLNSMIDFVSKGEYLLFSSPAMINLPYSKVMELLSRIEDVEDGKMNLRCGISGEYYNRKITVGLKYMLKLNHMARDKVSVRETGSYSVVSQQPLPGKSNCGGQRAGEMELWAVQSYGVAFLLHETITVKSDDIRGRMELYSNILKHKYSLTTYVPETVNVISSCIKASVLNFEFISDEKSVANSAHGIFMKRKVDRIANSANRETYNNKKIKIEENNE